MDKHELALGRIIELSMVLDQDMTESLARDGLTKSRIRVLWELRQRGPTSQRVLADGLRVSARTMTGLIDGLVATGFVTREPNPTDRRATLVTFTDRAKKVLGAMERDHRLFVEILFGGMPDERVDRLIDDISEILTRLSDRGIRLSLKNETDGGP